MASAHNAARICLMACRRASPQLQRLPRVQYGVRQTQTQQHRAISTTRPRWADESEPKEEEEKKSSKSTDGEPETIELTQMNQAFLDSATPEGLQQLDELAKTNGYNSVDEFLERTFRETPGWASEDRALDEELNRDDMGERPNKTSFWFDEEDPETHTEEHDEFDEDDITSMAHGKLDEIREMRHYARLAVWEMPLLAKLAKPFVPPTEKQVLRWRYTSYMGESHPAEKKVVVQFSPADLKLTETQTNKLKKLVGARYNPDTDIVKMSCESYDHQAQNKAYLQKLVDDLVKSAKDSKETFEDIPLDLRHHTSKTKPKFPREWRMTDSRRKQLDEMRQQAALAEIQKADAGLLIDGQKAIDGYLMKQAVKEQEALLVEAAAPRGKPSAAKRR